MRSLIPAVVVMSALSACSLLGPEHGTLVLDVSSSRMQTRTIVPNLDMRIATYSILGAGPSGAEFRDTGVPGATDTFSRDGLVAGEWTVTVDAYNATAEYIGTGTVAVRVEPRTVSPATVVLRPLNGEGSLEVVVSWPPGSIDNPRVESTLTPLATGVPQGLPLTVIGETAGSTVEGLATGYYTLSVQLFDGPELRAGFLEAVRILSDTTTRADVEIDPGAEDLGPNDAAETANPIHITLSGGPTQVAHGHDLTIDASPNRDVDSYAWYLNGAQLAGQTAQSLSIGSDLDPGVYRVDVLALHGTVAGSSSYLFAVRPNLITYLDQSRYVRAVGLDVEEASATGFEDFDGAVEVSRQVETHEWEDRTDTYVAAATQTSTLSPNRIVAVGFASDRGPFYAVVNHSQEAESSFSVDFALHQRSEVVLTVDLHSVFDTGGTNVSTVVAAITFNGEIPVFAAETDRMDGHGDPVSVSETLILGPGNYTLWLQASATGSYRPGDMPGEEVGGGGDASYSVELTVAPAP